MPPLSGQGGTHAGAGIASYVERGMRGGQVHRGEVGESPVLTRRSSIDS